MLGVLLEGPLGDRHRLPPPRTVPHPVSNCLQIDLRECFDTAPQPTGTSVPSPRSHYELVFRIVARLGFMKFDGIGTRKETLHLLPERHPAEAVVS